jgi:hypothetical protein
MSAMVMRHYLGAVPPAALAVLTLAMGMAPPRVSGRPVLFPGSRQALSARRRRAPGRAIKAPPVAPTAQEKCVAAPRAFMRPKLVHAVASATAGVDGDCGL